MSVLGGTRTTRRHVIVTVGKNKKKRKKIKSDRSQNKCAYLPASSLCHRAAAMPPKPSPSGSGKRRASDAAGGPQQTDLIDAFGVSPKLKRKGSLAAEAPLEVQVTPRQYDAFTVKFLETEGTARGFSAADKEEDARRSGTERKWVWGGGTHLDRGANRHSHPPHALF